ncbi:hypothetical protein NDU88_000065 [Pleurodeles waltl]|uniref:Uncharacterized protein n=1 Tax=Pleurodeles waltl TaxID=8319 RepID=A0AAV7TFK0_PLEWA|nr:hypothetical protein NDU88_000065 [Pleurodeles waltl]
MHCSVFSARPILVPQRYFLDVGAGPALTPPAGRALRRALSVRGRLAQCAVAYFLPGRGGSPYNVLYMSPGSLLHASFLTPRCYFLVMGAGPAPSPLADRAPSAHGRFIQCTAACSLLSRDESALQCAPLASAETAGRPASLRESPVSVMAASPVAPVPVGDPMLRDQTPPCSSAPLVPPGTDSTSRWSPTEGYFQGLIVGPSGATFSSMCHLGCLAKPRRCTLAYAEMGTICAHQSISRG